MLAPWKKSYDQSSQHIKKQRHYFTNKGLSSLRLVFPVVMYGCENCTINKAEHQRIDAFELWCWGRLDSPLDFKEIKSVNHKWNQSCKSIWRTDAEAEIPLLWPPDVTNWLIGRPWFRERVKAGGEGTTEDEVVGWHHRLDWHEFEQAPGVCDGQRSLACCSPWGRK